MGDRVFLLCRMSDVRFDFVLFNGIFFVRVMEGLIVGSNDFVYVFLRIVVWD